MEKKRVHNEFKCKLCALCLFAWFCPSEILFAYKLLSRRLLFIHDFLSPDPGWISWCPQIFAMTQKRASPSGWFQSSLFFSRSKVYSHFSALSIWRNDFFLETSASRPAWSHRVYKLHTHFTTTKHRRNTAEINWIRAHILIFIIVPVQTYLFHLCPQTAHRTMSSLFCAWNTHKIVIEMEKFIFFEGLAFFHSVLAPRLLDNQSNVQRQQQIHI